MTLREYIDWIKYLVEKSPEALDLKVVFQVSNEYTLQADDTTHEIDYVYYAPIIRKIDTEKMRLVNNKEEGLAILKIVLLN